MLLSCHHCDSEHSKNNHVSICADCELGIFCNEECFVGAGLDHSNMCVRALCDKNCSETCTKHDMTKEFWAPANRKTISKALTDEILKDEVKAGNLTPMVKEQVIHNLHINGRVFETYIRFVLDKKIGRGRVADKIYGQGKSFGYLTGYTPAQLRYIRKLIEDEPEKYDKEGWIEKAFDGKSRHEQ